MINVGGWWRLILWLLLAGFAIYIGVNIKGTLTVFGLAFFIAYLLNWPIERITGSRLGPVKQLSRGQAIAVVYLVIILIMTAGGLVLVPIGVNQATQITQDAPYIVAKVKVQSELVQARYIKSVPPAVRKNVETALTSSQEGLTAKLGEYLGLLGKWVLDIVNKILLLLSGLFFALYFLVAWHELWEGNLRMVPFQYKDDARSLANQMNKIFGGYVRATILCAASCGGLTLVLLLALTLWKSNPYGILLAFLAAATYPVPVVGVAITTVLAGILAYFSSGDLVYATVVALATLGANQVVDRTLYPKLMGDAIGVSALFILFASFAGGEFLGPTGMLLGVPLAAMGKALLTWIHARFLVIPEEQAQHSTQELWRRAAEVPAELPPEVMASLTPEERAAAQLAQQERAAWGQAASAASVAELARATGLAAGHVIREEKAHIAELTHVEELARETGRAAEKAAADARAAEVARVADKAAAEKAIAERAAAERSAADARAAAEKIAAEKAAADRAAAEKAAAEARAAVDARAAADKAAAEKAAAERALAERAAAERAATEKAASERAAAEKAAADKVAGEKAAADKVAAEKAAADRAAAEKAAADKVAGEKAAADKVAGEKAAADKVAAEKAAADRTAAEKAAAERAATEKAASERAAAEKAAADRAAAEKAAAEKAAAEKAAAEKAVADKAAAEKAVAGGQAGVVARPAAAPGLPTLRRPGFDPAAELLARQKAKLEEAEAAAEKARKAAAEAQKAADASPGSGKLSKKARRSQEFSRQQIEKAEQIARELAVTAERARQEARLREETERAEQQHEEALRAEELAREDKARADEHAREEAALEARERSLAAQKARTTPETPEAPEEPSHPGDLGDEDGGLVGMIG